MILNRATSQLLKAANPKLGLALLSIVILAACGGGDSSSSSSPTLNLNAAYTSVVTGGLKQTGTISGYCQGTRQQTYTPTVSGKTLSGAAALISYESEIDSLVAGSNEFCKSFYSYDGSATIPIYYDPTNVTPITSGATKNGYPLGLVWSNQSAPPTSVTAGATGTLATYVNYTGDSSRPATEGSRTWKVEADTATTLLWITTDSAKVYGTELLIYNSITTYRINANNTLTPLKKEVQATTIATKGAGDQTIYETYQN
jgi:hypothetical protein